MYRMLKSYVNFVILHTPSKRFMDFKKLKESARQKLSQAWIYCKEHPFKSAGFAFLGGLGFGFIFFMFIYFGAFGRIPNAAELK